MVALTAADYDGTWRAVYGARLGTSPILTTNDFYTPAQVVLDSYQHVRTASQARLTSATVIDDLTGRSTALVFNGKALETGFRPTAGAITFNMRDGNDVVSLTSPEGGYRGNATMNLGSGDDEGWGGSGNDRILGEAGRDRLIGGPGDDVLLGGDGIDLLYGREGSDTLRGGAGQDVLRGDLGDDVFQVQGNEFVFGEQMDGSVGTDAVRNVASAALTFTMFRPGIEYLDVELFFANGFTIQGTTGDNTINLRGFLQIFNLPGVFGGDGNDQLVGNDDPNVIDGGNGNDALTGRGGNDVLRGRDGDDVLFGSDGADRLEGGLGLDSLNGGDGADILVPGAGADRVDGGAGIDLIQVAGSDIAAAEALYGGEAFDMLSNVGGSALVLNFLQPRQSGGVLGYTELEALDLGGFAAIGTAGVDVVDLSGFVSILNAPTGSLHFAGGAGADVVTGNAQANRLRGDAGDDRLYGGNGDDHLEGGADADFLMGQSGNDLLDGGAGADIYFTGRFFGSDRVVMGAGDRVQLFPGMVAQGFGTNLLQVFEINRFTGARTLHGTLLDTTGVWLPTEVF